MKTASIFIPGQFDDAFLYMGRLLVFTANRDIQVWNLDQLSERLQSELPTSGEVPKWMFCRNDWLTSGQFHSLMKTPGILERVIENFSRFPQPFVEIKSDGYQQQFPLALNADQLLDVLVYAGRLYVATDGGLFDINVDWEFGGEIVPSDPRKRLEVSCLSTSANYGAVVASCGGDGLFTATESFSGIESPYGLETFHRSEHRSIRTAWLGEDLVNYSSSADPSLLRGKYQEGALSIQDEKASKVLIGLDEDQVSLRELFGEATAKHNVPVEDVQFVFNSKHNFFLNTYSGRFFGAGVKDVWTEDVTKKREPRLRYVKEYSRSESRILSAGATRVGVVLERDTDVSVWAQDEWHTFIDEPALSVRTFIKSKRYQNLVVATLTKGVQLTGLFDENSYY
jgi:hypothetical protein